MVACLLIHANGHATRDSLKPSYTGMFKQGRGTAWLGGFPSPLAGFTHAAFSRITDLLLKEEGTGFMTQSNLVPASNPNTETFLPQSTVMIVDDNAQNVELLQAFLEGLPVRIVTAVDGVDALEKVAQCNPDLILLDIMMPRMSGFGVCQKIKGDPKTRDIQILMVTALNELGDIEKATECGTDDFVSKPVNKFELLTRVKSLLRVRHLKGELERALSYLNEIEQDHEEAK